MHAIAINHRRAVPGLRLWGKGGGGRGWILGGYLAMRRCARTPVLCRCRASGHAVQSKLYQRSVVD